MSTKYRKNRNKIKLSKRGLILCEGETEEKYFQGFVTSEKNRRRLGSVGVEIYKPKNHSPRGLVDEAKIKIKNAKKEKNPFDFVWLVFDKDGHPNIADSFHISRTHNPPINIAFTAICFEYFVLLHFEKTTRPFTKCADLLRYIKSKKYISEYEKASNLYEILESRMTQGIENGNWCEERCKSDIDRGIEIYDLNAYSNVHELVIYLLSL